MPLLTDEFNTNIPDSLGTAGQVLTVNSGATAGEWADAAGGAWSLVDEVTVSSNTNTVDLEGMNSTYKTYCVVVNEASMDSGENIFMRFKNQGSYDTLVIYSNISHGARSGNNAWYIQQRENLSAFEIMNISSISQAGHSCVMYIHNASSATVRTIIHGTWTAQESGQVYMDVFSGCYSRTTNGETDGIRFFPNNRNWTAGNFRLYGIGG